MRIPPILRPVVAGCAVAAAVAAVAQPSAHEDDVDAVVGLGPHPIPGQHRRAEPAGGSQADPVTEAQDVSAVQQAKPAHVGAICLDDGLEPNSC